MPVITLSSYKTWAGISASTNDARLQLFIDAVEAWAPRFCGRTFVSATFTEDYSCTGTAVVILRNTPVTSITSVSWINSDGTTTTVDSSTYRYRGETGELWRIPSYYGSFEYDYSRIPIQYQVGAFPQWGTDNLGLRVVYVGGYTSFPADLQQAYYETVDDMAARGGLRNMQIDSDFDMFEQARQRFTPFVRQTA